MTCLQHAIDYIFFIIENNYGYFNFEERQIPIDRSFILSLMRLRSLYKTIKTRFYPDMESFLTRIKEITINNLFIDDYINDYAGIPGFKLSVSRFYRNYEYLITHIIRNTQIKHRQISDLLNLNNIDSIISSYDYYFEGRFYFELEGHKDEIQNICILPNDRIASVSLDGSLIIWNLKTRNEELIIETGIDIWIVKLLSDGRIITSSNGGLLTIYTSEGKLEREFPTKSENFSSCAIILPNNTIATTHLRKGNIDFWDTNGNYLFSLEGHSAEVTQLLLKDEDLISSANDGSVILWDLKKRKIKKLYKLYEYYVGEICLLGEKLVTSGIIFNKTRLNILNLGSEKIELTVEDISDFVVSDEKVVIGSNDGSIKIWSGAYINELKGHTERIQGLKILPNGNLLSCTGNRHYGIWDLETGTNIKLIQTIENFYKVSLIYDRWVIISDRNRIIFYR